jgi:hypothetical protein
MQRAARLVGFAYISLLLFWVFWVGRSLPVGQLEAYLLISGVKEGLAQLLLTPVVGLLISYWFVRRGRFWGATVALVLCVVLAFGGLITFGVDDFYFWRPALRGIKWPPPKTDPPGPPSSTPSGTGR